MVDLTCAEMIFFSPAKFSSPPGYLNFSSQALTFQDTVLVPVEDTLRTPVEDTLLLPVDDTLPTAVEDTLLLPVGDTLRVTEPGSLNDSVAGPPINDEQDTLNITPPDSLPDTSGSIWDRIDARDKEIETSPTEPAEQLPELRVQSAIDETVPETSLTPAKSSLHDASRFLDTSTNIIFSREHVFPLKADHNNVADSLPVFMEYGDPVLNSSSSAYESYMESGQDHYIREEAQYSATWMPAVIILSFLLLTWIKLVYVQFLTPVLLSAFNYKEAFKLYCNKNAPTQNTFLILHLIFAINGGLFLFFVSRHFDFKMPDLSPPLVFLAASSSLIILFAAKSAALSIISFLFEKRKLFAEYKHNISLYTKIFGILLLPVIVGLLYADQNVHIALIYTGLTMGAVFYLLQLIRGLEIIFKKEFSLFYLILYLCAFEILPILILIRLIQAFLI